MRPCSRKNKKWGSFLSEAKEKLFFGEGVFQDFRQGLKIEFRKQD
jgi:hypothetical protein